MQMIFIDITYQFSRAFVLPMRSLSSPLAQKKYQAKDSPSGTKIGPAFISVLFFTALDYLSFINIMKLVYQWYVMSLEFLFFAQNLFQMIIS
jgi:hypothetical protein